jgi:hypothetical protein
MVCQSSFLLWQFLTLLFFIKLLSLHNTEELITFLFSLLSKTIFLILKLFSAGLFKFFHSSFTFFFSKALFCTEISFVLFKCSLSSKSVLLKKNVKELWKNLNKPAENSFKIRKIVLLNRLNKNVMSSSVLCSDKSLMKNRSVRNCHNKKLLWQTMQDALDNRLTKTER